MARNAQRDRLRRRLEAIPQAVKDAVKPSLERSGEELANRMMFNAPKDTGAMAKSVAVTPGGQTTPAYSQPGGSKVVPENAVVVTVGNTDVRYAHLVEYGTQHAAAHPFFWPTFRSLKKKIATRTKAAIRKAVRDRWTQ